jgi:hypothetical protein
MYCVLQSLFVDLAGFEGHAVVADPVGPRDGLRGGNRRLVVDRANRQYGYGNKPHYSPNDACHDGLLHGLLRCAGASLRKRPSIGLSQNATWC